jgi:hypothetical protein
MGRIVTVGATNDLCPTRQKVDCVADRLTCGYHFRSFWQAAMERYFTQVPDKWTTTAPHGV